ncbi:hypothetical protein [Mesorhizobium sp. BHbdii]
MGETFAIRPILTIASRNCDDVVSRRPRDCRRIAAWRKRHLAEAGFFNDNRAGLLIVPALFFIHRRNGEVAEWSKALPC